MNDTPAGLAMLVETERRLDADLRAARTEAARLEHEGLAEAERLATALQAELAAGEARLLERLGAEARQARERLAADAAREAARWAAGDADVSALADWVVTRLTRGVPA